MRPSVYFLQKLLHFCFLCWLQTRMIPNQNSIFGFSTVQIYVKQEADVQTFFRRTAYGFLLQHYLLKIDREILSFVCVQCYCVVFWFNPSN